MHGLDRPVGSLAAVHGRDDAHPGVRHPGRRVRDQDGNAHLRRLLLRRRLRRQLRRALLPRGEVLRREQSGDERRVLLHGERVRTTHRDHHVRGVVFVRGERRERRSGGVFRGEFRFRRRHDVRDVLRGRRRGGVAMGDQRRHEVFRRAAVGGSGGETRGGEESGRGGGGGARA